MSRADRLHTLARRVRRLSPDRRDPEAFHLNKDEIWRELQKLARMMEADHNGHE